MALKVTPTALLSIFFIFSPEKEPYFFTNKALFFAILLFF